MAGSVGGGLGKSMAIWFPLKPTINGRPSVILHFNLWRLGDHGKKPWYHFGFGKNAIAEQTPYLLDVGIMVVSPSDLAAVSIYLPIALKKEHVEDLGPRFADSKLATAVFNESLTATNSPSQSVVMLQRAVGGTAYCGVNVFPISNKLIPDTHLEIKPEFEGTTLTITSAALNAGVSSVSPDDNLYFRIRLTIPKKGVSSFINAAIPSDKFLTSGIDVTEYLDFRINQARNLNQGIVQQMPAGSTAVPIARVDFLLALGVTVDVVNGQPGFHKCRLLESELWKSYVNENYLNNGIVVYHWKEQDKNIIDFNAFVRLRMRQTNWQISFRYLLIALVFGAIFGVCGNTTYDLLKMAASRLRDTPVPVTPPTKVSCPAPEAPNPPEAKPAMPIQKTLGMPAGTKVDSPALIDGKPVSAEDRIVKPESGGKVSR